MDDDDTVLVPPEVHEGLDSLQESGQLDPDDREAAKRAAAEQGYDNTVKWLEQVGDEVYVRAARGRFTVDTDD